MSCTFKERLEIILILIDWNTSAKFLCPRLQIAMMISEVNPKNTVYFDLLPWATQEIPSKFARFREVLPENSSSTTKRSITEDHELFWRSVKNNRRQQKFFKYLRIKGCHSPTKFTQGVVTYYSKIWNAIRKLGLWIIEVCQPAVTSKMTIVFTEFIHNRSRAKLFHSVYFSSMLDMPRPILSLWS